MRYAFPGQSKPPGHATSSRGARGGIFMENRKPRASSLGHNPPLPPQYGDEGAESRSDILHGRMNARKPTAGGVPREDELTSAATVRLSHAFLRSLEGGEEEKEKPLSSALQDTILFCCCACAIPAHGLPCRPVVTCFVLHATGVSCCRW